MTVLELDGASMRSLADLHEQVAQHPETPGFYGRNLDALYDVLLGFYRSPTRIRWHNASQAREQMGPDFARATRVFEDAAEELESFGRDYRFELIEGALPA